MEVSDKHILMIESLVTALQHNKLQPTGEDIADALWLALQMNKASPKEEVDLAPVDIGDSLDPDEDVSEPEDSDFMPLPAEPLTAQLPATSSIENTKLTSFQNISRPSVKNC